MKVLEEHKMGQKAGNVIAISMLIAPPSIAGQPRFIAILDIHDTMATIYSYDASVIHNPYIRKDPRFSLP